MPRVPEKVAARYIGHHPITLNPSGGPYYDGDGNRLAKLTVSSGDTLMLNDTEVLGQTYLYDPHGNFEPRWLGIGKRVLPEHTGLSDHELNVLGYEFHAGRPDFTVIQDDASQPVPQQQAPSTVSTDVQPSVPSVTSFGG